MELGLADSATNVRMVEVNSFIAKFEAEVCTRIINDCSTLKTTIPPLLQKVSV
jgi:hypothetical protein